MVFFFNVLCTNINVVLYDEPGEATEKIGREGTKSLRVRITSKNIHFQSDNDNYNVHEHDI